MRKKFKTFFNLFVLFFVIFYPIKSSADTQKCDIFVKALSDNYQKEFNYIPVSYIKNFGFSILRDYDEETQEWKFRKSENGNLVVGKIADLDLAKHLKSGNLILKINDQKFNDPKKQNEMLEDEKIKVEFFDEQKGSFILDLKKKETWLTDSYLDLEDMSVNKIDIKNGVFEVGLKYDWGYYFLKEGNEKLYDVIDGTILFELDDGWHYDVCIFSEEEFKESRLRDPGEQMKILDVTKQDKDLFNTYFKLTPYSKKIGNPQDAFYIEKKIEGVFNIRNKFNLRAFPFDKQTLSIKFFDGRYNLDQRHILTNRFTFEAFNGYLKQNEITGWNVTKYEINPFQYQDPFYKEKDFADGLSLNIIIERKHSYYIFKVILPIVLILMVCWSVVWIHPRELESRLTITIVCLLSLIAYNFVIDAELPKLEYLTVLDWIILISYLYAAIPNFLTIASFKFIKTNEQLSIKLESYGKRYGPTSYVAIIIFIIFLNANFNSENASALISWMAGI